ncbi:unnamed protein product [Ambrosiozyma monospora]|uniref:Unnamed protein product n=1 Tax=Ambrosiozyma monospora TaxID=43982 RepID=A0ACB5TXJ9_AMBMO|nr:unnamed protein product [Ambrosiozyma monospora]
MLPVCESQWVSDSIKVNKLQPVRAYSPDPKFIFKGMRFHCSRETISSGDIEMYATAVKALGATYNDERNIKTTHYVTSKEEGEGIEVMYALNKSIDKKLRNKVKIVLPQWVDVCLKLGRLIDDTPYLFPKPKILNTTNIEDSSFEHGQDQAAAQIGNKSLDIGADFSGVLNDDQRLSNLQPFLQGKIFYFGDDLGLSNRAFESMKSILKTSLGAKSVVNGDVSLLEHPLNSGVNCYVGRFRSGKEYKSASQNNLYVGNLNWLYWMICHNKWVSPFSKILHYPYPTKPLPGFEKCIVGATNYTGDSRMYLNELVTVMGGLFTKSLTPDNTHLLVAKPFGKKFEACQSWEI